MYYVYILQSMENGRCYVGVTSNLSRRLREHNSGSVKSTAPHRPWEFKKAQEFTDIKLAYRREAFIKSKHSRKIIEKIISGYKSG